MYGLEQQKKKPFAFDLEVELKQKPEKAKEIMHKVQTRINDLKKALRAGEKSQDYDNLGVLLQGYMALQKVLTNVVKS
jgi:hypothetical protein